MEDLVQDYHNLRVWKDAHQLTLEVYKATRSFPKEEMYGVTSQIRRSSTSIPTNIVEGCGRATDKEFNRFLRLARGSAYELHYLLELAQDLGYLTKGQCGGLAGRVDDVNRMIYGLIRRLGG